MIKFSSHSGINTLKVSQELDISLDEAWDFFSNPKNLSEITPKDMGFNITSEIPNQDLQSWDYKIKILIFRFAKIIN